MVRAAASSPRYPQISRRAVLLFSQCRWSFLLLKFFTPDASCQHPLPPFIGARSIYLNTSTMFRAAQRSSSAAASQLRAHARVPAATPLGGVRRSSPTAILLERFRGRESCTRSTATQESETDDEDDHDYRPQYGGLDSPMTPNGYDLWSVGAPFTTPSPPDRPSSEIHHPSPPVVPCGQPRAEVSRRWPIEPTHKLRLRAARNSHRQTCPLPRRQCRWPNHCRSASGTGCSGPYSAPAPPVWLQYSLDHHILSSAASSLNLLLWAVEVVEERAVGMLGKLVQHTISRVYGQSTVLSTEAESQGACKCRVVSSEGSTKRCCGAVSGHPVKRQRCRR